VTGASEKDDALGARSAALDLVAAVLRRRQALDEAEARHPGLAALEPRDRGFARLLAATVLRRLGQIDDLVSGMLDKPKPPKADAMDVLRLGAAQIVFLGTPAHAAVDTGVALAAARGQPQAKGLVNAVLRRVAREGAEVAAGQDAARLNTPDWLWLSWRKAYGTARARNIAEAHLAEPPLDITAKAGDPAGWADLLGAAVLPTGSLRRPDADGLTTLPGFAEGAWWVQDAAAAIPARLFGDVAGTLVYDLCAAPGGKTVQLAAAGARVVAVDRSARRLARVRENLSRMGVAAELVQADAAEWDPGAPADAVLLDAPCSATGAIRRHPDIQRLKTRKDVAALAETQAYLLAGVHRLLKPGGLLVYCTCSLEPEEGERQVAALLDGGGPFERVPIRAEEVGGAAEFLTPEGDLRTLPAHWAERGGIDGFYAARLRRLAD
jgi:16S rRNA (cytosine967-C5)-methyltransferase